MEVRTKKRIKRVGQLLFFIYIISLVYFLFFSERYGRTGMEGYRYNLELFAEIKRFIRYRHLLSTESFVVNLIGNVVGFMPFGFFAPMLSKQHSYVSILCRSFLLTLTIETTQLYFKVGIFDVDDLFLNTLGAMLGYVCYRVVRGLYRIYEKHRGRSRQVQSR